MELKATETNRNPALWSKRLYNRLADIQQKFFNDSVPNKKCVRLKQPNATTKDKHNKSYIVNRHSQLQQHQQFLEGSEGQQNA